MMTMRICIEESHVASPSRYEDCHEKIIGFVISFPPMTSHEDGSSQRIIMIIMRRRSYNIDLSRVEGEWSMTPAG